ncbi:PAS domain S-box protein [Trichothermofontia sp.]
MLIAIDSILHPCDRGVSPKVPIAAVLPLLHQSPWPILPIATATTLVGSFTAADGVRAIAQVNPWDDPVTVADYQSQAAITVPPTGQVNAFYLMQQMQAQASTYLLAQDDRGQLLGIISLDRLWGEWEVLTVLAAYTLADLEPLPSLWVSPTATYRQVATAMMTHPGHCAAVMPADHDQRLPGQSVPLPIGLLTASALLPAAPSTLTPEPVTASRLMHPVPLTLPLQTPLDTVWTAIQSVAGLPIVAVNQAGGFAGTVTALDLLSCFTPEHLYQRVQSLTQSFAEQAEVLAQEQAQRCQMEKQFHEITTAISQVFFIRSITGEFLYISPAYEDLWGRSRDDLYRHPEDWIEAIHPDDLEMVRTSLKEQFQGQSVEREYRIIQPNGAIRWIRARISTVQAATQQVLRFIGVAEDITDRKHVELALLEQENFLRSIYESVHDGIFVIDVLPDGDLRYVSINPAQSRLLGMATEAFFGQTPEQIFPPAAAAWVRQQYQKCIALGTAITYEELLPFQDQEYWWQTSLTPLKDSQGRIYRLVGTCANITELKRTEAALRQSLQEKEILLSEVHHRVKNNLQIISSLLSLQANRIQDRTAYDVLIESQHRISTMALIHEHLYQSEDLTHIHFAAYVERLLTNIFATYSILAQHITYEIVIDSKAIIRLEESIVLGLILNELINNALQHAFPKGRSGKIGIHLDQTETDSLILTVWDDGIGLLPDFEWENIQSMGLRLVQILAGQLSGKFDIRLCNPTSFKLTFPYH